MNIRAIFFDLDNTLFDHSRVVRLALHTTFHHFIGLHDGINFNTFLRCYLQNNDELWKGLASGDYTSEELRNLRFSMTLDDLNLKTELTPSMNTFFMSEYMNHHYWIDGARNICQYLSGKYPVGVITNGFAEVQRKKFKHLNLQEYVLYSITSEEAGVMKPNRRIFDFALTKSGTNAKNTLYVGDHFESDIIGAKQAGWKTAWYNPERLPKPATEVLSDFEITNFSELIPVL